MKNNTTHIGTNKQGQSNLDYLTIDETKDILVRNKLQVSLLNKKIKSVFSPIRHCVKDCIFELESISGIIKKELSAIENIDEQLLAEKFGKIDEVVISKHKHTLQFLNTVEDKFAAYQVDLERMKQILVKLGGLYLKEKHNKVLANDFNLLHDKIEKINSQIHLIESTIQNLISQFAHRKSDFSEYDLLDSGRKSQHIGYELLELFNRIRTNISRQFKTASKSINQLDNLSIYLQYEDIIGQKLEHMQEIMTQFIDGISVNSEMNVGENGSKSTGYHQVIPDLSRLLYNHLSSIQKEYHSVVGQVVTNAVSVREHLEELKQGNSETEVEDRIIALGDHYRAITACVRLYDTYNSEDNKYSPFLDSYLLSVLNDTHNVLVGIVDYSAEGDLRITEPSNYNSQLTSLTNEIKDLIKKVYSSLNEIISNEKERASIIRSHKSEIISTLSRFEQFYDQLKSKNKIDKKNNCHQSNLSASLSSEMEMKLKEIQKIQHLDEVFESCKNELNQLMIAGSDRKITDSGVKIFQEIEKIYSMDSEREIHKLQFNNNQNGELRNEPQDTVHADEGSIELF